MTSRSTIGDMRREGIARVGLHCYGITRDGVTCHATAEVALDALGLSDDASYDDIARRGWRCRRCGHRRPSVMPLWPNPREVQAGRSGAVPPKLLNGIVV